MAKNYAGFGQCTVGTNKTAIESTTTAAVRVKIYEFFISCGAAPVSAATVWQLKRTTAAGTGTAFTPGKIDDADPASVCTVRVDNSVEPTYAGTAALYEQAWNQQASFCFKANPGKEYTLPASATAGVGMRSVSSTGTAVHLAGYSWEE